MKKSIIKSLPALLAIGAAISISSCSKGTSPTPVAQAKTQGQIDSALLVNRTLTSSAASGHQGSNDNGATWHAFAWYNETLLLKSDRTYLATQSSPSNPNQTNSNSGTWSISADGKTLNLGPNTFVFTIVSVTATTCVFVDPNASLLVSTNPNVTYAEEQINYN